MNKAMVVRGSFTKDLLMWQMVGEFGITRTLVIITALRMELRQTDFRLNIAMHEMQPKAVSREINRLLGTCKTFGLERLYHSSKEVAAEGGGNTDNFFKALPVLSGLISITVEHTNETIQILQQNLRQNR
jgi:hypothetical protein